MSEPFSCYLYCLRTKAKLTNAQLAQRADVPESLISGLQNDNRRVGEFQAGKIGRALGLAGDALDHFIYEAIDNCTEKVLNDAKSYPSRLLNLLAMQLRQAGIAAEAIWDYTIQGDEQEKDITLTLSGGRQATLKTQLVWT